MNTTAAASQAGVTVDTIRYWCRYGAVAAIKQAGRWVIDAASLAHRIALGKPSRRGLTIDTMTAIGGREWQRGGKHRVYLNDWASFLVGFEIESKTVAYIDDRRLGNGMLRHTLRTVESVYYDDADGQLHVQHWGADHAPVHYAYEPRGSIDLIARIRDGVKAAVAAL